VTGFREFMADMAEATLLEWALVAFLGAGGLLFAGFVVFAICATLVQSLLFDAFVALVVVVALVLRTAARRMARSAEAAR
jgi:hypothetical protein